MHADHVEGLRDVLQRHEEVLLLILSRLKYPIVEPGVGEAVSSAGFKRTFSMTASGLAIVELTGEGVHWSEHYRFRECKTM